MCVSRANCVYFSSRSTPEDQQKRLQELKRQGALPKGVNIKHGKPPLRSDVPPDNDEYGSGHNNFGPPEKLGIAFASISVLLCGWFSFTGEEE